ncbi:hypothetical protein COCC4DRAFT_75778 [Bipolaris maydis ATCC 48331]|uniref:ASX DEUBAD domain-containing protein n=2 Tax=Cochliobolus heterostrophus TaxID=5016 RepID=M2TZM3_COCH5|nr:uncharacterized protein COCC4DRAFT_75778 [Bipolaris maydis ATCC 48331]EMD87281.1 hypothetical protein COCHEDRAFT_1197423 [Bipolaris maydis C5]KAJ5056226.1 Asx homology domain-containing protein [Bipolaris maydis]ENI00325.1 hypothetical protein COCC4DRAFT_75778 [Bipolaris maydis ATCC 48331]KAJ6211896.1 Asx homology domain-containing protein [Bipolaris maydis]KAJ6267176.1 Asx homology domain-containing protein [Bipolaris maydis]
MQLPCIQEHKMSLPVRSPSKESSTSHHHLPTTVSPTVNVMSSTHHETNKSSPKIPDMETELAQIEATSSSLTSQPTSPDSSIQMQHAQAPQLEPTTTSTSDAGANCASMESPKTREEDHELASVSSMPHSKRINNKASATPNSNATMKKPARKRSAPGKTTAPTPSRSQPSRNRKAPERFENFEEKTAKALPSKKGTSKVFDSVFITTNSTSRLVKADIYHMLLEGSAWSCLSAEQQSTLIAMLPQDSTNQGLLTKINAGETEITRPSAFTLANDCFRTDVAKFQEDLKNGHLAKTWQTAAEQAVIERAAGEYDRWKAEEAESWWGQKSV